MRLCDACAGALVVAAVGAMAGGLIDAHQPQQAQQPTFRSTADLVRIDAVVVDAQGRHVRGLTAADFTLLDRGKPQKVETFEEVTHERAPAPPPGAAAAEPSGPSALIPVVASNQTGTDDRIVVMVVDDLHLFKNRTDRAKEIARGIVNKLGPGASMAVLFTSGDFSTEITQSKRTLTDSIDSLKGRRPFPRPPMATVPRDAGTQPNGDGSIQNYYEHVSIARAMRDASNMLKTSANQRKAFVLVSEWFPTDLTGMFQQREPPATIDMMSIEWELSDMMDAMRRSNVVTYAIDPRGAVSSQQLMRECHPSPPVLHDPCLGTTDKPEDWSNWVRQSQHGLEITTEASGGFAITNTDDFTGGLDRILDDLDHYYLVGFYPDEPEKRGYRPLELKVNRPGLTVRSRKGYEVGVVRASEAEKKDPLDALATSVVPKSAIPLRLVAIPLTRANLSPTTGRAGAPPSAAVARETPIEVALEVSTPVDRVVSSDGKVIDSIRYTVFAANIKTGKVVKQFSNTAEISSTAQVAVRPGAMVTYQLPVQLSLEPGRYQLRAAVLSEAMKDGGSVYVTVDVPSFIRETMPMSALVIGYAEASRLAVTTGGAAKSAFPFVPTLAREFSASDRLRLYFDLTPRGAISQVLVEILDTTGKSLWSMRPPLSNSGREAFDIPISLTGLPAGSYRLRATAIGSARNSRELTFAIR